MAQGFTPGAWLPVKGLQQVTPSSALGDAIDAVAKNRMRAAELEEARQQRAATEKWRAEENEKNRDQRAMAADDRIVAANQRIYAKAMMEARIDPSPVKMAALEAAFNLHGVRDYGAEFRRRTVDEMIGPEKTGEELMGRARPTMEALGPQEPTPVDATSDASVEAGIAQREAFAAAGGDEGYKKRLAATLGPNWQSYVMAGGLPQAQSEYDAEAKAALEKQAAERANAHGRLPWHIRMPGWRNELGVIEGAEDERDLEDWHHVDQVIQPTSEILSAAINQADEPFPRGLSPEEQGIEAAKRAAFLASVGKPGAGVQTMLSRQNNAVTTRQSGLNAQAVAASRRDSQRNTGTRTDLAIATRVEDEKRKTYDVINKRFSVNAVQDAIRKAERGLELLGTPGALPSVVAMTELATSLNGKAISNSEGNRFFNAGGLVNRLQAYVSTLAGGSTISKDVEKEMRGMLADIIEKSNGIINMAAKAGGQQASKNAVLSQYGGPDFVVNMEDMIRMGDSGGVAPAPFSDGDDSGVSTSRSESESRRGEAVGNELDLFLNQGDDGVEE